MHARPPEGGTPNKFRSPPFSRPDILSGKPFGSSPQCMNKSETNLPMNAIDGFFLIKPEDLSWRPSNMMRIPNADFLERTKSEILGAPVIQASRRVCPTPLGSLLGVVGSSHTSGTWSPREAWVGGRICRAYFPAESPTGRTHQVRSRHPAPDVR